jgi:undecaprenyl diphosphate synthase
LTLFALSSENIQRPSVNIIFDIIVNNFESFLEYVSIKNDVKIKVFGNKYGLKKNIKKIIETIEINTKENNQLFLNVALNYGAKNEIVYCFNNLLNNKNIKNTVINEKIIRENLYLPNTPDPDILIRTGGFQRLSNFLLFQLSYTELFFTKTLWPDITKQEIKNIFNTYLNIERKYGL